MPPILQLDGRLEVHLEDPDGNKVRVGALSGQGRGPNYTDVPEQPRATER
jgi:hypothetical protein